MTNCITELAVNPAGENMIIEYSKKECEGYIKEWKRARHRGKLQYWTEKEGGRVIRKAIYRFKILNEEGEREWLREWEKRERRERLKYIGKMGRYR